MLSSIPLFTPLQNVCNIDTPGSSRSSSGLNVQGPMVFVSVIPSSNFTSVNGSHGSRGIPEARSCGRIHFNGHAVDGIEGVAWRAGKIGAYFFVLQEGQCLYYFRMIYIYIYILFTVCINRVV